MLCEDDCTLNIYDVVFISLYGHIKPCPGRQILAYLDANIQVREAFEDITFRIFTVTENCSGKVDEGLRESEGRVLPLSLFRL